MKKFLIVILAFAFGISLSGCSKKDTLQEMGEPMTMEALSTLNTATPVTVPQTVPSPVTQAKLEPLPPAGPYKPTAIEIQTALKNAGFYAGEVDGKIGPKSKKAIEEFQKTNGLKADGKVGLKTWEALSKHLSPPEPVSLAPEKKKR